MDTKWILRLDNFSVQIFLIGKCIKEAWGERECQLKKGRLPMTTLKNLILPRHTNSRQPDHWSASWPFQRKETFSIFCLPVPNSYLQCSPQYPTPTVGYCLKCHASIKFEDTQKTWLRLLSTDHFTLSSSQKVPKQHSANYDRKFSKGKFPKIRLDWADKEEIQKSVLL